jgi:hypothetical protein
MALSFTPLLRLKPMRVINGIPLMCSLLLPVGTENSVQTLKGSMGEACDAALTMNSATALMTAHNTEGVNG